MAFQNADYNDFTSDVTYHQSTPQKADSDKSPIYKDVVLAFNAQGHSFPRHPKQQPSYMGRRQTMHHASLSQGTFEKKHKRRASWHSYSVPTDISKQLDSGRGSLASSQESDSRKSSHASAIKDSMDVGKSADRGSSPGSSPTLRQLKADRTNSNDSGVGQLEESSNNLSSIPETQGDIEVTVNDDVRATSESRVLSESTHFVQNKFNLANEININNKNDKKVDQGSRRMWIFRFLASCLCFRTEGTTSKHGTMHSNQVRENTSLQPIVNQADSDSARLSPLSPNPHSMSFTPECAHTAGHEPFETINALKMFQQKQYASKETITSYTLQMPNFAAAFITEHGGRIVIPNRPVNLYVPPGALPDGAVQLVYVYIKPGESVPSLDEKETWLSPSVHCGPSGLKFKKDVFLTVPHSATEAQKWEFNTYQTKKSNGGTWKKLEDGQETLAVKHKAKCLILMNHFCGHRLSGVASCEDAAKRIDVTVQLSTCIDAENNTARINVFIANAEEATSSISVYEKQILQYFPQSFYNPSGTSTPCFSKHNFTMFCLALQFLENSGLGWSAFAGQLGVNPIIVHGLREQHHHSPAAVLLGSFLTMPPNKNRDPLEVLKDISQACTDKCEEDCR